jgi:two-component system, OmpR family, response regulator MprA
MCNILVVEDNLDVGDSMVDLLQLLGHHVSLARNGLDALEFLKANAPELVISDLDMPSMDGLELARRLRLAGLRTPMLALTAQCSGLSESEALAVGFDLHMCKPFEVDELERAIRRLLP